MPLAAAVLRARRRARTRAVLALDPPRGHDIAELACLVAVPLLLALAAAGPAIRSPAGRGILKNAEAIFVFDTSRSMGAAAGEHAPTRLDQAKTVARELREAIPDVPSGVASITTQLLPELFPTADEPAFTGTVNGAIGVLKPLPPAFQTVATDYDPLASLRDQGFFTPSVQHRVAILFSDGESVRFFPKYVGQRLSARFPATGFLGGQPQKPQAPVKLIVLQFGSPHDRIYHSDGTVDPGYRPELSAPTTAAELAHDAGGLVFRGNQATAAAKAVRSAIGSGSRQRRVTTTKTTQLAIYAALASLVPLAFLVWRRNLAGL
jgi:hypothetical protein